MTRKQALPYVLCVVDDVGGAQDRGKMDASARLVGWQCDFEPVFVAVQSYLPGVRITDDDAAEIATDYLVEIGWFADDPQEPDYII